jgi:hypothetical protein
MKTSLKVAVAGALALAGANALATSPADIQAAAANGTLVTLYVSGATATDGALENLFKLDDPNVRVCVPDTLDIYYYRSTSSGTPSQRALTCTAAFSGTGIVSGTTKLALLKESAGGSANGIVQPANLPGTPQLQFIDLSAATFPTACATVTTSSGLTLPTGTGHFNTRDCGATSTTASTVVRTARTSQAGISDVDPTTFVGTGGVTAAHDAALTRKRTSVAVTFNPIVSVPLFTVLQRAYGTITDNDLESTSSLASIPSLPSSVLRAVFNGTSVLNANEINLNGQNLADHIGSVGGFDDSGDIYICRRGDTSGTMTSFKLHFLNQGCSKTPSTTVLFVAPDTASCQTSGCTWNSTTYGNDYVFAGAGSGDVRQCIDYHTTQGRLAIGIASTESKPGTTQNTRFRYIKVDGAEPTLKATIEGRYSFFTENTFNDRFPSTSASGSQTLWDKLYASIGNPTAISELNRPWRTSAALTLPGASDTGEADTGILDTASSANAVAINTMFNDHTITGGEVRATPINSQTRQTLSGQANNCNPPYQAYP